MSIAFNGKSMASLMFNGKLAAQIFFGAKLIWQKIQKLLEYDFGGGQSNCYEIVPTEDIPLSSISAFAKMNNTSDMTVRIINECGLLIANSSQNGVASKADLYNLTGEDGGFMNTVTSLGTVTLFKGNKYYINVQKNGTGRWNLARYQSETGNYKSYSNVNQMWTVSGAGERKSYGLCTSFDDIKQAYVNGYFSWGNTAMQNQMAPGQGSSDEPYPYLLKRDMSKVKYIFTDSDFNGLSDDIARYAYIYYKMGNTAGDEFIMNVGNGFGGGFAVTPGSQTKNVFTNSQWKIYTSQWPIGSNHITSMTPVDDEPSEKHDFDLYYKSSAHTWGDISARAVVIWYENRWQIATGYTAEFQEDSTYTARNYCEQVQISTNEWTARQFVKAQLQTGSKWYFKANNIEV